MILESTTVRDLAAMLAPHMDKPAWPGLNDPKAKARARTWAKKLGLWERLGRDLDPKRPIRAITRSDYRDYRRTGRRSVGDAAIWERQRHTENAALALWLGHPAADLDYLQDLLWSWCETTTWVWPAHESCTVDLGSSHLARVFAEILWMLDGQLEDEVKERMGAEIERRALDPLGQWRRPDWWGTATMNWNHVCNANLITTALYRIRDAGVLAATLHPLVQHLDYALQGFPPDGGCLEGPAYWNYGFGHFVDAALVLHHRTGGKLDLLRGEHIERICRYPLAAHIEGPFRAAFADGGHGYMGAEVLLGINRFFPMPELYEVAARDDRGRLAVRGWRGLLVYNGEKVAGKPDLRDYVLPDLGYAKLRSSVPRSACPTVPCGDGARNTAGQASRGTRRGEDRLKAGLRTKDRLKAGLQTKDRLKAGLRTGGTTLLALAGRNDVPHNHNDIGSFILHKHGACLLTDPGAPRYTAKTFGPKRYEILFCRSRGHSVPLINGREQPTGSAYHGTLAVEGLSASGPKSATIDMTHAYDDKSLKSLIRRFTLAPDGSLELVDTYAFRRMPRAIEEAFITFEPTRIVGGQAVLIGEGRKSITLSADGTPGRFAVERLVEESKEGPSDAIVTRITFIPSGVAKEMRLAFRMQ